MTYAEKLLDPRWQKKRLEILQRDNFTCRCCKRKDNTLHVHHLSYSKNPWETVDSELITYCNDCHRLVEWLKKGSYNIKSYSLISRMLDKEAPLYCVKIGDNDTDAHDRLLLIRVADEGPEIVIRLWPLQFIEINYVMDSDVNEGLYV